MSGYIGTQPVPQATQTRDSFTATSGQTSFATGGYTPNFLDVYLNGVKLAAADYTASNGSDVVLASGAATGDILEVVAYTAFDTANVTGATNFTVTGAFTSQGIDDNANSTALTIDASENVLVGTTNTLPAINNVEGIALSAGSYGGRLEVSRDGAEAVSINRKTNDGSLMSFKKDGTTVGSIGSVSGTLYIGSPNGSDAFAKFNNNSITPSTSAGAARDNAIDLGAGSARFKDLYLSGGIYLGGAVAANKLDDYEEGTWNVTDGSGASLSFTITHNRYTKIGRLVMAHVRLQFPSTSNTSLARVNLPFTADANSNNSATGGVVTEQNYASNVCITACINDTTRVLFRTNGVSALTNAQLSGKVLRFTVTYNAS